MLMMWCKWYISIYISTKTRIINLRLHESLWMEQNQVLPSILLQLTCPPLEELSISKFQMPGCSQQWLTTGGVTYKKLLSKPGKMGLHVLPTETGPQNILQQRNLMPLWQISKPSPQRVFSTARLQRHAMSAVSLSVWAGRIEFWKAL